MIDDGMDRLARADVVARLEVRTHERELIEGVYLGPLEPMGEASAHDLFRSTQPVRRWYDNPFDTVQRRPNSAARIVILVESNICTRWAVRLMAASASKKASNTPARLRRQKRFHTEFQGPYSAGRARHVML